MAENIHASCVALEGQGILILGPSGSGKSDLALRLIDAGATLVGDDRVMLEVEAGVLYAAPHAAIAGNLEVRGVGILEFPYTGRTPLALVIDVDPASGQERFPENEYMVLEGMPLPLLKLSAFEASTPLKIRLAMAQKFSG